MFKNKKEETTDTCNNLDESQMYYGEKSTSEDYCVVPFICVCESHSVMSDSLQLRRLQPARFLCPWNSPGQNTGVGSHSLFQGIFQIQGLNPGLPLAGKFFTSFDTGSPGILEWVAHPFFSGISQSRNRTGVSYIAGKLFLPTELPGKGFYIIFLDIKVI